MQRIVTLFFVFIAGGMLTPLATQAQPGPRPSLIETLNQEASSTDAEGLHAYSKDLIEGLVGNSAGPAYAESVTDRLTQAELMARHGKRKLISETDILEAFNGLMKETGASDSLRADLDAVRKNRQAFAREAPELISSQSNGSYCNPGEAIWVIEMLIANIGRAPEPTPQSGARMVIGQDNAPVHAHLETYLVKHSRTEIVSTFNHLFSAFKI